MPSQLMPEHQNPFVRKVWIKIFPDKPVTAKPAETRMGSGGPPLQAGRL